MAERHQAVTRPFAVQGGDGGGWIIACACGHNVGPEPTRRAAEQALADHVATAGRAGR